MRVHREMVAGLVEADVAVVSKAEQLQVDAVRLGDGLFVRRAGGLGVLVIGLG